jgi:hypothetical protein
MSERWVTNRKDQTEWDGGATFWDIDANVARTYWDFTASSETWTGLRPGSQVWTDKPAGSQSWTEQ